MDNIVAAVLRPTVDEIKQNQEIAFVCPTGLHLGPDMRVDEILKADLTVIVEFADTRSHTACANNGALRCTRIMEIFAGRDHVASSVIAPGGKD